MATSPTPTPGSPSIPPDAIPKLDTGHLFLNGVSWTTYESLLFDLIQTQSAMRMTYDRGMLEILRTDGGRGWLLCRLIWAITEELNVPLWSVGSTTVLRKSLGRGLDPDDSFWIDQAPPELGERDIYEDAHPAPNLIIDVPCEGRILDRIEIYAAMGFPEVWRYDGKNVTVGRLQPDGTYSWGQVSGLFPFLPMDVIERFLDTKRSLNLTAWSRRFRDWVRAELAPHHARPRGE